MVLQSPAPGDSHWRLSGRLQQEAAVETSRFDDLAISLADERANRRSVLGRLLASGAAAALGVGGLAAFSADDAEAKKKKKKSCKSKCNKKKGNKKKKCKQKCASGTGAKCAINTDCAAGQICINASCTTTCVGNGQCTSGKVCVNGACVTGCTTTATCGGGQTCVNGGCTNICTADGDCTGGQVCIQGVCGTPNTPPTGVDLCGPSLPACGPGLACVAGICVIACTTSADCAGGLVCGSLLGDAGLKVCVAPSTPCGPQNPCTSAISACVLGICIEVGP